MNTPVPRATPTAVFAQGAPNVPEVALTFDSNMTTFMLAELARHRVRSFDNSRVVDELISSRTPATFFLSGLWVQRYPAEARRIIAVPWFEIGSHSYLHEAFHLPCYGLAGLPAAAMRADIARSEQQLRALDPQVSNLFRFPGGCYDAAALRAARSAGVQVVQYSDVSGDAFNSQPASIVATTLRGLRAGVVIVMHITGGNTAPATADALPTILAALRARHLLPVTVSQLMQDAARPR
jgi:peptidoglycan/xylan/chitin deacetylase (PgdA/CDA1 family)